MNALDLAAVSWRKSTHSGDTGGDCVEVADVTRWRKSTHSTDTGGQCVEVADVTRAVAVRDSKDPGGPVLGVSRTAFTTFVGTIRAGTHDLT